MTVNQQSSRIALSLGCVAYVIFFLVTTLLTEWRFLSVTQQLEMLEAKLNRVSHCNCAPKDSALHQQTSEHESSTQSRIYCSTTLDHVKLGIPITPRAIGRKLDPDAYPVEDVVEATPPIPLNEEEGEKMHAIRNKTPYGGRKDPKHLGGYLANDSMSWEPELWKWIVDEEVSKYMARALGARSVIDVGCGVGISTQWFVQRNVTTMCVEGSPEALKAHNALNHTVLHDYQSAPFVPTRTFDVAWSIEFLEHIESQYMDNYIATLKRAEWLFVSHSRFGGWHHVAIHDNSWWIARFEQYGFKYRAEMTDKARKLCPVWDNGKDDTKGSYFHYTGLVFFNPMIEHERMRKFKGSNLPPAIRDVPVEKHSITSGRRCAHYLEDNECPKKN